MSTVLDGEFGGDVNEYLERLWSQAARARECNTNKSLDMMIDSVNKEKNE